MFVLFCFHYCCRIYIRSLANLPIKRTHGDDRHEQQGEYKDANSYRSLPHKVCRILVDEVVGNRYGYHKRSTQYRLVFLEKQLVQVLHAGSVCLADSDFTIALADIEQRDAEQAEARHGYGYQGKDGIDDSDLAVVLIEC